MHAQPFVKLVTGVLVLVCAAALGRAAVRLPAVFSDNMVLQRGEPAPVWGWADAGEKITVRFAGQEKTTEADDEGRWRLALDPLDASREPRTLTVAGEEATKLENVLVGEVWVCSGQSNMEWPVSASNNASEEIASADYPRIRLITVKKTVADQPRQDFEGEWVECSPQTVGSFSAVGYFFGRKLHKELNVPIGLIDSTWGGTPAEAWTRRQALENQDALDPLLERWRRSIEEYDAERATARYEEELERWKQAAAKAEAEGTKPPGKPRRQNDPADSPHRPAVLYNGMIAPLVPYAIRGVIWYQGESNASRAYQYRTIFPTMIRSWRRAWGQGELPFYFVQLANFMERKEEPGDSAWAELREAQLMTLRELPNTGMAVITDIGEAHDIHPRNKQDVGKRLARWTLAKDYGKDVVHSGPLFQRAEFKDGEVVLRFDHVGGGLVAKGDALTDEEQRELRGFAIAGADKQFQWADAKIEGDTVIVSHPDIENPKAVRYNWADNPAGNLYNEAGLPASPFRTDDWEGVTEGRN